MKIKTLIVFVAIISLAITGCNNGTTGGGTVSPTPAPVEVTLAFPTVTLPSPTLNFKPSNLPAEITYTLSDDGTTTWNSTSNFDGIVNSSSYSAYTEIIFTQTFHKDGKAIGSQIVKAGVGGGAANFITMTSSSGNPITQIPGIKLVY